MVAYGLGSSATNIRSIRWRAQGVFRKNVKLEAIVGW